MIAMDLLI